MLDRRRRETGETEPHVRQEIGETGPHVRQVEEGDR